MPSTALRLVNAARLPTIDPARLSADTARAAQELMAEGEAPNTVRSYQTALRYWAAWFELRFGQPFDLPVPQAALIQFIVDHVGRTDSKSGRVIRDLPDAVDAALVQLAAKQKRGPLKLSTVQHRLAVLSKAHQLRLARLRQTDPTAELRNPCEEPGVRQLMSRARRAASARGEEVTKKKALVREDFDKLVATCDDSLVGIRDRALLYFAFASGGRRRSEVVAADVAHLQKRGPGTYVYELRRSKTRQTGDDKASKANRFKPVSGKAGAALEHWLEAGSITDGPIFRRIFKTRVGGPLTAAAVAKIVQSRAAQAGMYGDFGAHSLRSGFVTEGGRRGVPLPALMAMTGHADVQSVIGYYQAGEATENPAAALLDD